MNEKTIKPPKRKRSFLQFARKKAKRGHFGLGTKLEEDVFRYYCRVLELKNKGFDSEEDKRLFANNVLDETRDVEIQTSCNQVASRALESVISWADSDHIRAFEKAFEKNLRLVFVDRFCSFVTQLLIKTSTNRVLAEEEPLEESFAFRCSKFAVNNVEEFATDTFACHVVRTCVDCLAQLGDESSKGVVKLFYSYLIESSILSDLSQQDIGSALLQRLLYCLNKVSPKTCQKAISKMINSVFAVDQNDQEDETKEEKDDGKKMIQCDSIPKVFTSIPIVRLLEVSIECSNGKRFTQIYAKLFINKLGTLAKDKKAYLAVQKLIRSCNESSEFESIFDELSPHLDEVLSRGHTGVIESLASTCKSNGLKQGEFINVLMKILDVLTPEANQINLVQKCQSIGGKIENDSSASIGLHGSLIIQSMLHFKKPIKVIRSLLEMEPSQLVRLFSDSKGSHITDAFFTGQFVGEKSKDKLVHKLKGSFVELAVSKHGSRSFESIWEGVGMNHKFSIIEELKGREAELTKNQFGRIISSKIGLSHYRRDKNNWEKIIKDKHKSQTLFKDILE